MKKTLIIIGGVVIVILIFAAASYVVLEKEAGSGQTSAIPAIQTQAQAIIASGSASQCASLGMDANGVNYQTVCENNIAYNNAMTNLDVTACSQLDNKMMSIADCQNTVILALISKNNNISVCSQFAGALNTSCVDDYWSLAATAKNDPSLCANLSASSTVTPIDCEYGILLSSIPAQPGISTTTPNCSLYTGVVKNDCTDYINKTCQAITFQPVQRACQANQPPAK